MTRCKHCQAGNVRFRRHAGAHWIHAVNGCITQEHMRCEDQGQTICTIAELEARACSTAPFAVKIEDVRMEESA